MTLSIFFPPTDAILINISVLRLKPIFSTSYWASPLSCLKDISKFPSKTKLLILPSCLFCQAPIAAVCTPIHQQVLLQNTSPTLLQQLWFSTACSLFQSPEIKSSQAFLPPSSVVSNQQAERMLSNVNPIMLSLAKTFRVLIQASRHLSLIITISSLPCLLHWSQHCFCHMRRSLLHGSFCSCCPMCPESSLQVA